MAAWLLLSTAPITMPRVTTASLFLLTLLHLMKVAAVEGLCRCNGFMSGAGGGGDAGIGQCSTEYQGRLWCYVDRGSGCPDEQRSKKHPDKRWSYLACLSLESTTTITPGYLSLTVGCSCNGEINKQGLGECRSKFKETFWCYVDKNSSCQDKNKSMKQQELI